MVFPATALDIKTEMYIGGQLVDITRGSTSRVLGDAGIAIRRGQRDESNRATASSMDLDLYDPSGVFLNRNPSSAYYGLISRNTPIRCAVRPHLTAGAAMDVSDTFSRASASAWGSADSGNAWSINTAIAGSVAADYNVAAGFGTHSVAAAASYRESWLAGTSMIDADVTLTFKVAQATGAPLEPANVLFRGTTSGSVNTYYNCRVQVETTNAVTLYVLNTAGTSLGSATVSGLTHTGTGQPLKVRARCAGPYFMIKCWIAANAEPSTWHLTVQDATSPAAGWVGIRSGIATANTNVKPVVFSYDAMAITYETSRFFGEAGEWSPRWDKTGSDVRIPIRAGGILRRLGQGSRTLRSALYRATVGDAGCVAYWPLEDGPGPAIGTDAAIVSRTDATFSSGAGPAGSSGALTCVDGIDVRGPVTMSGATAWSIQFAVNIKGAPTVLAASRILQWHTSGTWPLWAFTVFTSGGTDTWGLEAFDTSGTRVVLFDTNFATATLTEPYGRDLHITLIARQNGGNVEYEFGAYVPDTGELVGRTGGSTAGTLGNISDVVIPGGFEHASGGGWEYSHWSVWSKSLDAGWGTLDLNHRLAAGGHVGETAVARLTRLCTEEGVSLTTTTGITTVAMGAQRAGKLVDLLNECADAEQSPLLESRDWLALVFQPRSTLYSPTTYALDYAAAHLSGELLPADDDQNLRNDVTARRPTGTTTTAGSYRLQLQTGALSVLLPPNGVGPYDRGPVEVNVNEDTLLPDVAGVALGLGTVDEYRYPTIQLNLERAPFVASASLTAGALGLDSTDVVEIDNPPSFLQADPILAFVRGYEERLSQFMWQLKINATPASPYYVFICEDATYGHLADDGLTLSAGVTTTATSWSIATTNAASPLLSIAAGDYPVSMLCEGEKITITAVAGAASPQTATVTRSVNGIVKAHGAGAAVTMFNPPRLAR